MDFERDDFGPSRFCELFGWPSVVVSSGGGGTPDVVVRGNGVDIANGDATPQSPDHTVFVSAAQLAGGTTRTYTVANTGTSDLIVGGLTVPTGFSIVEGLSGTIGAGSSDTFTVRLNDATLGTKSGNISFTTNVAGKNPYTFAITGEVVAATSDWHNWASTFTGLSETRRNLSPTAKTKAPFSALITFNVGEVPADTWFQATCNGLPLPTNWWQLGERSTFPDGSLRSAMLRAIVPGSWAPNTPATISLTKIIGSRPPETDTRPLSSVTGAGNFIVELDDITEPENRPNHAGPSRRSQQAWVNPQLRYVNNRALALPTAVKRTAGAVMSQWVAFEVLRTPDGLTEDTQLWSLCATDTWYDPDSPNTVIHQMYDPILMNGWANTPGYAKVAKIRLMNGASVLHDYSDVLSLVQADWNNRASVGEWDFTDAQTDFSTFRFRVGDAVKVEGTPPANLVSGNIYQVLKTQDMGAYASSGRAGEITQLPYLGLAHFGIWNARGGNGFNAFNNLPVGTGGGSHTLTSYVFMTDKTIHALRDNDGGCVFGVGGAIIEPDWTRAEKIRRIQTGQIPSIPIDEFVVGSTPFLGQASNSPKNTSGRPGYSHLHAFGPGRSIYHRGDLNTAGVGFQGGNHLNECDVFMFDVLNDMANINVPFWRIQKIAAAEAISFPRINCFDESLVSGQRIAKPVVLNNGPTGTGTSYPGMGPSRPQGGRGSFGSGVINAPGANSGQYQQNEMSYFSSLGDSGSHSPKAQAFGFVLRGYYTDLLATQHLWTLVASQYNDNAHPLFGRNKTHNGINYWHAAMLGTGVFQSGQPRSFIGWNYFLSFCLYTPDADPESRYFKDVAETSVAHAAAMIKDPTIMGQRARVAGPIQQMPGGGNQLWMLGRHCLAAVYLLKRSGVSGPDAEIVLKHLTAMARLVIGAPEGGGTPWMQTRSPGYNGWTGFVMAGRLFDLANSNSDPNSIDPRTTVVKFLDAASSVTDGSELALGIQCVVGTNTTLRFNTNNTVDFINIGEPPGFTPINGDKLIFTVAGGTDPKPPGSVPEGQHLYIYDLTGSNFKLSTTPGPSFTQVTWSIGAPTECHVNNTGVLFQTRRVGSYANGLLGILQPVTQVALEYIYETLGSMNAAKSMFGAAHLDAAISAYDTFRARAEAQTAGVKYMSRAYSNVSWAMLERYPPGAA